MINVEDKTKCSGCEACVNCCPAKAIIMQKDEEGFFYPRVTKEACTECGLCEKVCPYLNRAETCTDLCDCYTALNPRPEDRAISSSGGIFIQLARWTIKHNGIVFGARFDENWLVYHDSSQTENDLIPLVGSKYLQSRINDAFERVKTHLNNNKMVLFVGTSCQIAGLKKYLGREHGNLICVDFICLGIPSPTIWAEYLNTFFDAKDIRYINFKDKSYGWNCFSLKIQLKNDVFIQKGWENPFFLGYFRGYYSRPSCSQCIFKTGNRVSDITISDCWGSSTIAPDMDDNKGLSSVVCHTKKGRDVFLETCAPHSYKKARFEDILKFNENYYKSAPMNTNRDIFWHDFKNLTRPDLFSKYCSVEKEKLSDSLKKLSRKVIKLLRR